ncbi:MAG: two-component system response regulator [Chloroflexi bacterium RBG_19FT_COMBO_49_13]|nr:MAG: two-component system response regulator [Chloroflexi bacterium RBG_19FT_COMBO_49_13]
MAKILVADNDREVREMIIFALRFAGHEVLSASNGEEALSLAKQSIPDLILMDVRMPKMNGYETCKALKTNKDTLSIPVIFLSARGQDSEVQAGLQVGAADYILKPIAPDRLVEKIKPFLQKSVR